MNEDNMTNQSVTEQFVAERQDGNAVEILECGTWYSGFTWVKERALENKIPLVAVWSNGDACGYCKKLEGNFLTDAFKVWMKTSKCIFWFGYSGDTLKEDKTDGMHWARENRLTTYPFMRFYWTDGTNTVNKTMTGNDWNEKLTDEAGAKKVIAKLEELISEVASYDNTLGQTNGLKVRVNPEWSEEKIAEFRKALADNDGYCPCEFEHTADTKCMCKNFREQTTEGNCHCGLYDKYISETTFQLD